MTKKGIMICVIAVIILGSGLGSVDLFRVKSFQRPLFCICTESCDDGVSGHYIGLGYSFDIKGNFMAGDEFPGVTEYIYYILGFAVRSGIRD